MSTGHLHLDLQIWRDNKKDTHRMVCVFFVISVHFRCHIFQLRKLRNHENSFNLRSQVSILLILDERKQFTPRTEEKLNVLLLFGL